MPTCLAECQNTTKKKSERKLHLAEDDCA